MSEITGERERERERERPTKQPVPCNFNIVSVCVYWCPIPIQPSHHKSGNVASQINFILFRRTMRKLVTDVKVIPGKEVALQHQLLVCDVRIDVPLKSKCKFTPGLKVWKLKDHQTSSHFQEVFNSHVREPTCVDDAATEDIS